MSYVGVDLHTNCFTVCYRTAAGKERMRTFAMLDLDEFRRTLRKRDEVAVEATGNTRWFVERIESRVKEVVVVNPSQFEVITKSVSKTDKQDARTLALYLSKGMLPRARMKDEQTAQLHSLAVTRDKLVKQRTALINKIHAVLNSYGLKMKKESLGSARGLQRLWQYDWPTVVAVELKVLADQIRSLSDSVDHLDRELVEQGRQLKGHKSLSSIKGIGERSSTVLLSVIGNVRDFKSKDKLAAYVGIVPRVSRSNETQHHGRITKRGSKLARTTLVQCALVAMRYSPYLRAHYEKIKRRRGSGKAIIATARKLLGIIYDTLMNGWVFEDFPNFVLARS